MNQLRRLVQQTDTKQTRCTTGRSVKRVTELCLPRHMNMPIANARYVDISVSIDSFYHSMILKIIQKDASLANLSLWNRIHRDSVYADINLNSLYYP